MSSKVIMCNLGLSHLGNYGSLENIDTPRKPAEIVFAKWWDTARRMALKEIIPHFALDRRVLAPDAIAPAFGYSTRFAYPSDCVRVLGFGEIQAKENNYSVEGGFILTDCFDEDEDENVTLNLRFVKDVDDVTLFTPEFIDAFAWFLAYNTNMEITQDMDKQVYLEKIINSKKTQAGGINSQENPPIRINNSKFRQARTSTPVSNYEKK